MVDAQHIPRRISQIGLAPEPGLVFRIALEDHAFGLELADNGINVVHLEIDDDIGPFGCCLFPMDRERGPLLCLETRVPRRAIHDLAQTQLAIKADGFIVVLTRKSDLIQVHLSLQTIGIAIAAMARKVQANGFGRFP